MKASVAWINQYLSPGDVSAVQAEELLTFAGLPIDGSEPVEGGDTRMEVEVTSNRGDCLCHVGLAREIAAASGGARRFVPPTPTAIKGGLVSGLGGFALRNGVSAGAGGVGGGCPRFTLRLLQGVKVGPSPAWLRERLEAIGQRSINNAVDCTNFVLHELGQPSHVFDAAKVRPGLIDVRPAAKGERLELLDGSGITLGGGELVICDAGGPVSLAGVMGGASTSVSEATTDLLVEVATWEPVAVRSASRRHGKRTDSSYRYERNVDARTLDGAADRLVGLLLETCGGRLAEGVLDAGATAGPLTVVTLRRSKVNGVLGIEVPAGEIERALTTHGFGVTPGGDGSWNVTVPPHRPDVSLEIDLIEEVARTIGYDRLVVPEKLAVAVPSPQGTERARREMARVLTGLGFFEAVTFSFTSDKLARPFATAEGELVSVSDQRRGEENVCRPSALCGLLECRRHNQDNKSTGGAPLRLFETATVFSQRDGQTLQRQTLALVMDWPSEGKSHERRQNALRQVRGVVEQLTSALCGGSLAVERLAAAPVPGVEGGACASLSVNGRIVGWFGLLSTQAQGVFGLQGGVGVAELDLEPLLGEFPPRVTVKELPIFPPTERDLSLIVDEGVAWDKVRGVIDARPPARMESLAFVTTYRGQPLPAGKKSVTLRMTFRAADRTLRDDEVNSEVAGLVGRLGEQVGATLRTV